MHFLYYNPKLGPKFIQKLFGEMEIAIAADRRQIRDWLATGKYALALFASREVDTAKRQGLPVDELTSLKAEGSHFKLRRRIHRSHQPRAPPQCRESLYQLVSLAPGTYGVAEKY